MIVLSACGLSAVRVFAHASLASGRKSQAGRVSVVFGIVAPFVGRAAPPFAVNGAEVGGRAGPRGSRRRPARRLFYHAGNHRQHGPPDTVRHLGPRRRNRRDILLMGRAKRRDLRRVGFGGFGRFRCKSVICGACGILAGGLVPVFETGAFSHSATSPEWCDNSIETRPAGQIQRSFGAIVRDLNLPHHRLELGGRRWRSIGGRGMATT